MRTHGSWRRYAVLSLAIGLSLAGNSHGALAAARPALPAGTQDQIVGPSAAQAAERLREAMEWERVQEQIAEDEKKRHQTVEQQGKDETAETSAAVKFVLKKVLHDSSAVLPEEEIQKITADYLDKEIEIKDLQEMAEKITTLYREKGYVTCRAVIPPQRIHDGVVRVQLVEGRTGTIRMEGNKNTKECYIRKRLSLTPGAVDNIETLNRELQWFHGTNDVQLRLVMKPGTAEGTTDYDILVFEPPRQNLISYSDNNGYKSSGRWRNGLFYTNRSLTGIRDTLRVNYMRSRGSDMWGLNYSIPVSPRGVRLDVEYTGSQSDIKKGELQALGVEGKASSYGMTVRVPLKVEPDRRYEAGLQLAHQSSKTDLGHGNKVSWLDDSLMRYIPYISFTHYGHTSVVYHKHSLLRVSGDDSVYHEDYSGTLYRLASFYQKRYTHGQYIQGRLDIQQTSSNQLASADRFFIGGANTVRGYEESFIGGEKGLVMSMEYHVPCGKSHRYDPFAFLDFGTVSGETAPDDKSLISIGLGTSYHYRRTNSSLTLGIPFKRELNNQHVDAVRLNLTVTTTF